MIDDFTPAWWVVSPASGLRRWSAAQPTGPEANDPDQALLLDATDACRTLLLNALAGGGSKVIMVTSAMPGEGKTTLATQLALSLGRGGCRTLLIDADVRHPGVHNIFGRSPSPGLSDVLRKTYPLQYVIRRVLSQTSDCCPPVSAIRKRRWHSFNCE